MKLLAIESIDGSHVPVTVPAHDAVNLRCRHDFKSQNVLAICDFAIMWTLDMQTEHDILLLLRGVRTIYQKFIFGVTVHLKGSMSY